MFLGYFSRIVDPRDLGMVPLRPLGRPTGRPTALSARRVARLVKPPKKTFLKQIDKDSRLGIFVEPSRIIVSKPF